MNEASPSNDYFLHVVTCMLYGQPRDHHTIPKLSIGSPRESGHLFKATLGLRRVS